ncbi:gephyrin-like molybdotransferase Glp [Marinomonas algicola]|uniref:molybdopterin molybdotransferase MoeA n=1 Tax=Marinomonas algicola TaxID=2773454 RepID=UPI001747F303|nr:gephyrin-like molybdotransferase Glp [Marinomonas algicola]
MPQPSMMAFEEALTALEKASPCLVQPETIPLNQALNRVLAVDIMANINIPPADNSAMDGYALRLSDRKENTPLNVSQRIPAGSSPTELQEGTCARIFTGAIIPKGADTVIMQENTSIDHHGQVTFTQLPQKGDNVRLAGQDVKKGQCVLAKGTRLKPQHIGMLASLGVNQLNCFKPLKVGILTTGDELISPEASSLELGQIYNSNSLMLVSLVQELGHSVQQVLHAKDTTVDIETALKNLSRDCELILSSGGVSVGEEDHIKQVIEENGFLSLWKVAIKPGKPIVFGRVFNTHFIGLPGNPSSTLVTFHWFARTAILGHSGETFNRPKHFKVKTDLQRAKAIGRDEFLRAYLTDNNQAQPHAQQSSGALFASCVTDGYLHIPAHRTIDTDQTYDFYPFSSF